MNSAEWNEVHEEKAECQNAHEKNQKVYSGYRVPTRKAVYVVTVYTPNKREN